MGAARKAKRPAEPTPPRAKILRGRVEFTTMGTDGIAITTIEELSPSALAAIESAAADAAEESAGPAPGDGPPSVDEIATAAQKAAQLRFCVSRGAPSLVPEVDRLVRLLRRLPGVAEELQRRHLGRG
jgi:hypothetical protein